MQHIETLWGDFTRPIETADDYIASLRGRRMNIFSWASACRNLSITR
jgi:hypothetical protein